jgi:hypothetical protein
MEWQTGSGWPNADSGDTVGTWRVCGYKVWPGGGVKEAFERREYVMGPGQQSGKSV